MTTDPWTVSHALESRAERARFLPSQRLNIDNVVPWLLEAGTLLETCPEGPHSEHWDRFWDYYLTWKNEERIDLGETTRAALAQTFQHFLDSCLKGLQQKVWVLNAQKKGLHIANLTSTLDGYMDVHTTSDPLHRILNRGWSPQPLLDFLYTTEDEQRQSLQLTTEHTSRWTWENHPYWRLLRQLSVHTMLGDNPPLAGPHNERMWRVAPFFECKNPPKAIATLAQAIPESFAEALEFYVANNYRMSPRSPNAIFRMDPALAPPLACVRAVMHLLDEHSKGGCFPHGLAWLSKKFPELLNALQTRDSLGVVSQDDAAYWVPLWNKLVHGQELDSVALPEGFDAGSTMKL